MEFWSRKINCDFFFAFQSSTLSMIHIFVHTIILLTVLLNKFVFDLYFDDDKLNRLIVCNCLPIVIIFNIFLEKIHRTEFDQSKEIQT